MDVTVKLERTTCWCGIPFMLPERLLDNARNHGQTIYCPMGHSLTWGETELDRVRRERDRLKQQAARLEDEKREAVTKAIDRAKKAEKLAKSLKKRTAAGTCPCCQRTFANMAEHMKHQHPEFVSETGAKVVPIKRVTG